jgi:hypothetical protein
MLGSEVSWPTAFSPLFDAEQHSALHDEMRRRHHEEVEDPNER